MSNDKVERKIEFIVDTLAQVATNDHKHDQRLSRLERVAKLMVNAGLRERRTRSETDERLKTALADLAEAHQRTEASIEHTDRRLDALINIVRKQQSEGA